MPVIKPPQSSAAAERPKLRLEPLPSMQPARDRAIADHLFALTHHVNSLDDAIGELHADVTHGFVRLEDRVASMIADAQRRGELPHAGSLTALHPGTMRARMPSLSEYDPELTPAGGLRLDAEGFSRLQQKIADMDAKAAQADAEKRGAEKAKREAELAASEAERKAEADAKKAERARARILFVVAILTPAAALLGWCASHFHW